MSTYYVNVGREHGIAQGDVLHILRDGDDIATVQVDHVSSKRAACSILSQETAPATGDKVAMAARGTDSASALTRTLVPTEGPASRSSHGGSPPSPGATTIVATFGCIETTSPPEPNSTTPIGRVTGNELVKGEIYSASTGAQLGSRLRLEIGGGIRDERAVAATSTDLYVRWTNLLADFALSQGWYASFSFERSGDGPDASDQIFSMLSRRF